MVYRGHRHAVLNWQQRRSQTDAIVSRPLSREELRLYCEARERGLDEPDIFRRMLPHRRRARRTAAELNQLTKKQLVDLVMVRLGAALPSLGRMTKDDLQTLYLKLRGRTNTLDLSACGQIDKEKGT